MAPVEIVTETDDLVANQVAGVADPVVVAISLVGVGITRAVVTGSADAIAVRVCLIGVILPRKKLTRHQVTTYCTCDS